MVKGISKIADVEVERLPKLIDSTNMTTKERAELAEKIYKNASKFDGFVIIHGTDSMVETGAALTFMVQGLGKPIILTGAQMSIYNDDSDGPHNVRSAIKAATMDYGEVAIVFNEGVYRAVRAMKYDESALTAFTSPRTPTIGKVGIEFFECEHRIRRHGGELRLFTGFDTNVAFFYPASGLSVDTFTKILAMKNVHGAVFAGFGAGNIPNVYYRGIERAVSMNKPLVVVTQCPQGAADMGIYEVGAVPLQLGAISGGDMTIQTATQKLMYALGKAKYDKIPPKDRIDFVKQIIHTDYAKEIETEGKKLEKS